MKYQEAQVAVMKLVKNTPFDGYVYCNIEDYFVEIDQPSDTAVFVGAIRLMDGFRALNRLRAYRSLFLKLQEQANNIRVYF